MPRLRLRNPLRGDCPPEGYRYVDPFDGWISHAWDYFTWVEQQERHMRCNGREVPLDLGEQMQEQLCLCLPPGWCSYDIPGRARAQMQLDWKDVLRGAESLSRWMAGGAAMVDKKEAERRAEICTRCYYNVPMSGCSICQGVVEKLAGKLPSTRSDRYLQSCAACKCSLRMKVHFPLEILDKENPGVQELYPQHCWLRKGGPNYGG